MVVTFHAVKDFTVQVTMFSTDVKMETTVKMMECPPRFLAQLIITARAFRSTPGFGVAVSIRRHARNVYWSTTKGHTFHARPQEMGRASIVPYVDLDRI